MEIVPSSPGASVQVSKLIGASQIFRTFTVFTFTSLASAILIPRKDGPPIKVGRQIMQLQQMQ